MRVRYCSTISREVIRPSCIPACISRMVDSTTVNVCLAAPEGREVWVARRRAAIAKNRECVIAIRPLEKMERKRITLLGLRLLLSERNLNTRGSRRFPVAPQSQPAKRPSEHDWWFYASFLSTLASGATESRGLAY